MSPLVNQAMRQQLLDDIARERSGEAVQRSIIRATARMLMQLGADDGRWAVYNAVRRRGKKGYRAALLSLTDNSSAESRRAVH